MKIINNSLCLHGLAGLMVLVLSSCTTPPTNISDTAIADLWTARRKALENLHHWQIKGRVGIIRGEEGWHADFRWQQHAPDYRIDVVGPLGQGRVLIKGSDQAIQVKTQDGRRWNAPDPDTALENGLGVRLPLSGLRYWVRGLPAPGTVDDQQMDAKGRLTVLEQKGWIIKYPAYVQTETVDLPARITAKRIGLSVKLAIEQWNL